MSTLVLAGLGNPGNEYAATRHNAGWQLLSRMLARFELQMEPTTYAGDVARIDFPRSTLYLLRPVTYMNRSGDSIAPFLEQKGISPSELMVAVDEIQLPVGRLKLTYRGSSGGQNGVQSIIDALGSQAFGRMRIGVGPLPMGAQLTEFVLSRFPARTLGLREATFALATKAVLHWAKMGGDEDALRRAMEVANSRANQPTETQGMN